jgi:hypothetical protein
MPDPKQMSGIPRPVSDLPDGSITVLVVRGSVTNGLPGQTVELRVGSKVQTAKTDDAGRVQFDKLPAGETLKASATVDGEHLESQEFPAPGKGGIRLLLAATDNSKAGGGAPATPAVTGQVTLGGQSRIILEPGDDTVAVYYLLEIVNSASGPVNPPKPFVFDMPDGAVRTGILQGSSPLASAKGSRITVQGPFPPGTTLVQVGCELPSDSDTLEIAQRFPAAFGQFSVIAKKIGTMKLASPQLSTQQEMTAQGELYIAAGGSGIAADQVLSLTLSELPHHSAVPRLTSLGLALAIVVIGAWLATRNPGDDRARAADRKRLVARRDKLLNDLVRLEQDRRNGRTDERRYAARREELVASLELVYGALDDEGAPDPSSSAGVAA